MLIRLVHLLSVIRRLVIVASLWFDAEKKKAVNVIRTKI